MYRLKFLFHFLYTTNLYGKVLHCKKYRLHILDVIYPDTSKSVKENSEEMCQKDYLLKKCAYEKIYAKPLTYDFEISDIAGWTPNE